jgi:ATP-dependent helicase/DNAse subunit B
MSSAFEQLKSLLESQKKLSTVEIEKVTAEHGVLSEEERIWLESERFRLEREAQETVTMEQYLEALKVLDTAAEGSPEYQKADDLVTKYEKGH